MKKIGTSLLFLAALLLTSCLPSAHNVSKVNVLSSLLNADQSLSSEIESESTNVETRESSEVINSSIDFPKYDKIDIDLTTMSATLVYSEVYDMLSSPSPYIGKVVKMSGPFLPFNGTEYMPCYPAILIRDATACCASGIEFILYGVPLCTVEGGNGYPLYNEEATIVGRFETYIEGSYIYVHLVDAIWLEGMNK